ncbi:unnamed protein product [Arctia plantaginis]|uniref:Uncharacterized protein n=1 Tax=Arctia plantaginis TaxID=874455 RepID=A0A8S1ANM2_ARCPL|nr:unnamed protein product [Arctia plantaginis]
MASNSVTYFRFIVNGQTSDLQPLRARPTNMVLRTERYTEPLQGSRLQYVLGPRWAGARYTDAKSDTTSFTIKCILDVHQQ